MTKRRLYVEVVIVLGLSLGANAVYSVLAIIARLTAKTPLGQQTTALNASQSEREWLDFSYQFLGSFFGLMPVALVLYLLWRQNLNPFAKIGLDWKRPGRDLSGGLALLAIVGIPGLGLYLAGRLFGITVSISTAPLDGYWWSIPILLFAAARAALSEEIIVIAYLFTRLAQAGWNRWSMIVATALLRGSYHLYQGIGPFIGNTIMGVVFGWCYQRFGRVAPLVVAHFLLDTVSFVGYPLAVAAWPTLFAS